ncbi:DUF4886 domain-containing protein [Cephaloticoccus primus]|nr:DUF4886 domain-containing protein [Cephaloticoccus primus]
MLSLAAVLHLPLFAAKQVDRNPPPLKVLAIGNSFSEDAVEQYLFELAAAAGREIIIGNLYIGGAPIHFHVDNIKENKHPYSYRKIESMYVKTVTQNVTLAQGIADEDWDYISVQQVSPDSGRYDVIMKHLPQLLAYIREQAPNAKIVYHQTWAYQHDSTHGGFANYDRSQEKMYNAIIETTRKISELKDIHFIIPCGTAVQNARTSSLGDTLTKDGYHLEMTYGRFIAACTWYEKLLGLDVRKNPYKPDSITELQSSIAKEAAYKAVKTPFKVSKIKK